jgi:AcrR family transcriptional regulator
MPATQDRKPRRDQVQNRERLLDAARAAFLEDGVDGTPSPRIARLAGVGTTTLYRHFPSRDELHRALFERLSRESRVVASRAAEIPDPWESFAFVFEQGCTLSRRDLGLYDELARSTPGLDRRAAEHAAEIVGPSVDRAHAAGVLDPQLDVRDIAELMRLPYAISDPGRRQRLTAVILAGLRRH